MGPMMPPAWLQGGNTLNFNHLLGKPGPMPPIAHPVLPGNGAVFNPGSLMGGNPPISGPFPITGPYQPMPPAHPVEPTWGANPPGITTPFRGTPAGPVPPHPPIARPVGGFR